MKNRVSGHSGLPEEVELRQLEEKRAYLASKTESRYNNLLTYMNSMGIAPFERRRFFIGFMKWLEEGEKMAKQPDEMYSEKCSKIE